MFHLFASFLSHGVSFTTRAATNNGYIENWIFSFIPFAVAFFRVINFFGMREIRTYFSLSKFLPPAKENGAHLGAY